MILFLNVYITDDRLGKYDRGLLPSDNRLDIFKYSLASLSVINWNHVAIYYELDINYKHRKDEIEQYIKSLFRNPTIYPFRNERQSQWKIAMDKLFILEDDFVWFCCNDDHIFVDYQLDFLKRLETRLIDINKNQKYVSCYFSHWPELLEFRTGRVEDNEDFFVFISRHKDSVQIVNKNLLKYWWIEHDYGNAIMPRSDGHVIEIDTYCVVPYRELVRHFDGYTHNAVDINACPPLFIPEGFFDDDIKILYCSDTRKKGYVSINPLKENYTTIDNEGADMRCMLEDIPLFWRSRISKIEIAKDVDRNILIKHRNDAVLKMATQRIQTPVDKLKIALRTEQDSVFDMMSINFEFLRRKASWTRKETLKIHKIAQETRLASSLSCVEIFVVLYYGKILNYDSSNIKWENRDRFIISKGHGAISLYPIFADLGYFDKKELNKVCKEDSFLGGIPDSIIPGFETINGSLGHGLGVACGISLALKRKQRKEKIFVLLGDGELYEGSIWEAIMFAGEHKLDNMIVIVDSNKISMLDYCKNIIDLEPLQQKFEIFKWNADTVDGHDVCQLYYNLKKLKDMHNNKPSVMIANTVKGKGVPDLEKDVLSHVRTLTSGEIDKLLNEI